MDDPHIKAFTILSDRVSTVEEQLGVLIKRELWKERTAIGTLDHTLLGFPFHVHRCGENTKDDIQKRQEVAAALTPDEVVITFEHLEWPHRRPCADPSLFEKHVIDAAEAIGCPPCPLCHKVGVTSHLYTLCEESMSRKLKECGQELEKVAEVDIFPEGYDYEFIGVRLRSTSGLCVDEFIKKALELLKMVSVELTNLRGVNVYPSWKEGFEAFKDCTARGAYTPSWIYDRLRTHSFYHRFFEEEEENSEEEEDDEDEEDDDEDDDDDEDGEGDEDGQRTEGNLQSTM